MIDHQELAGSGTLEVQDKTDGPDKIVDLYVGGINDSRSQTIAWSYKINDVSSSLQNFHYAGPGWGHLATVYVGYAQTFTLHLEPTPPGSNLFLGPHDLVVNLQAGSSTKSVGIKVGDQYKRAIPFVKVDGVWMPVTPLVNVAGEWKETT